MKILYVTSEASPFCKTGGLADVAGSLPQALAENGEEVAVILPLYGSISGKWREKMTFRRYIYVDLSWRHLYCGLFSMEMGGVTWYFVDNEQYFGRSRLYGEFDDGERFAFFCRAVVSLLPSLDAMPEVIHCNDWQTALVPAYLRDASIRWGDIRSIRTVFTIHNIEYQGRFGVETVEDLFGLDKGWYHDGTLAMDGDVNLMKGALLTSDAVTAVSPTYASELRYAYYAHGMEGIINMCWGKMHGVLNGIDMKRYDPAQDAALAEHYTAEDLAGKAVCREALLREMELEEGGPVLAIVSRLVAHKGLDLVCEVLDGIMDAGVRLVVLGQGDSQYEDFFRWAESRYPGRIAVRLTYSDDLAMRIYSGTDLFLMPSKSEPCGLSQMIAMRYGAVPIVRETGGLKDTVHSYEAGCDKGNGFTFANYNAFDMLFVVGQAAGLYREDPEAFARLRQQGMTGDYSWKKSAGDYAAIYRGL